MPKRKIVRNIFLIAGGFVLLLIVLAEIFKDRIVKTAIEKGAKTFEVPLGVGEVDFSLLYRFPYATIEFNDIVMLSGVANDTVDIPIDTVAGISKLYASVDMVELTKGNILVKKIEIKDVHAKYVVDSLGRSNFDFLLESGETDTTVVIEDTTKVQGVYTLDKLELENIELEYIDHKLNTSACVQVVELEMNGEMEPSGFKASTVGDVLVKSVRYGDFNLGVLDNSNIKFDVTALNDTVNISEFVVKSGTAALGLSGTMIQKDSAWIDVNISGTDINIAENLSILPKKMLSDYKLQKASGFVNVDGTAKGFVTENTLPYLDVDFGIKQGAVKYDTYPEVRNIELASNFTNGYARTMESTVVNVKKLHAETENSKLNISAKVQNPDKLQYDVVGDVSVNLDEIRPFVPDSLVKDLGGNVWAKVVTAGVLPDSITDDFTDYFLSKTHLQVRLEDVKVAMDSVPAIYGLGGTFDYRPQMIKLQNFKVKVPEYNFTLANGYVKSSFKGKVSDYENLSLKIDSMMFAMPYSYVSAAGKIDGLKNIKYDLKTDVSLQLGEIKQMLPDSLANRMSGTFAAKLNSSGAFHIDSVADKAMPLFFENSDLKVSMNNIYLDMPDTLMNVKMLSGEIAYRNDSIYMDRVSGSYLGLDFGADKTTVSNVYSGAIQNSKKQMHVYGNFEAGDINYAWIEAFMIDTVALSEEEIQAQIKAKQEEEPYVQNYTIKANGKVKVKSFKYGDVLAENINSKFLADLGTMFFVAEDLTCNVFDGDVKMSLKYEMNQKDPSVENEVGASFRDIMHFKSEVNNLNVSRMMFELETYIDQEDFKKDNVKGILTGTMDGKIVLQDYNPVYEEMLLKGDIKLEDGALINVKPVMEIEDIPVIKLEDMDKLYFSTLESKMFLFKNKMYFPRTNIQSSSFDAMFFGMYSFGEDYAYHLKMYMNQLLSKKDKDALNKLSKEYGFDDDEVKDGKRPIYVVSKVEDGKSKAGLDNRKSRLKMDAKVKLQKQMVDMRFHPKLVIYDAEVEDE